MSDCCAQLIYTKRSNWRSNWRSPEEWDPWYYLFRYILYTDIDVIFTGDITLDTFGVPLPKYFTMGAETHGDRVSTAAGIVLGQGRSYKCGNAGVMLLNTRNMRRAHSECVGHVCEVLLPYTGQVHNSNANSQVYGMDFLGNQRGYRRAPLWDVWAR